MSPSKQRYKEAVEAAKDLVYKNKGKPYCETMNPYKCGKGTESQERNFKKTLHKHL